MQHLQGLSPLQLSSFDDTSTLVQQPQGGAKVTLYMSPPLPTQWFPPWRAPSGSWCLCISPTHGASLQCLCLQGQRHGCSPAECPQTSSCSHGGVTRNTLGVSCSPDRAARPHDTPRAVRQTVQQLPSHWWGLLEGLPLTPLSSLDITVPFCASSGTAEPGMGSSESTAWNPLAPHGTLCGST